MHHAHSQVIQSYCNLWMKTLYLRAKLLRCLVLSSVKLNHSFRFGYTKSCQVGRRLPADKSAFARSIWCNHTRENSHFAIIIGVGWNTLAVKD